MQRVVLIGENEGSSTVLFTPDFFSPDDPLPIENIILINPFSPSPQFDTEEWRGRESARAYFRKRLDPVMADNFVVSCSSCRMIKVDQSQSIMPLYAPRPGQFACALRNDTKISYATQNTPVWSQWSSQLALVCILY